MMHNLLQAGADYVALRCDVDLPDPHPLAESWASQRDFTLPDMARELYRLPPDVGPGELSRAIHSTDFGESLATGLSRLVRAGYGRQAARWSPLLIDAPTRGLRPIQLPTLDLGEIQEVPKAGGIPLALATIGEGETLQPAMYAVRFLISRELLLSDGIEVMQAIVNQLVGQAARLTPRLIGAAIVANANLNDGSPLIGAGNTTSADGLDLSALGEAMALLRNATTDSGNTANAEPRFLLVPPSREAAARTLIAAMSADAPALEVLPSPWIGSDCYVVADPADLPTFARTYPRGIDPVPSVERGPSRQMLEDGSVEHYDGQAFEFGHYIGVAAVGRGIAKIPAA